LMQAPARGSCSSASATYGDEARSRNR
jgi:hypothetical protein